ncbi:helix-turn-helix transcriptional regulator [Rhizobium sp. 18065]|uniref:helix-turn-helix transcriptional regulator n=1 Tax=Rhizobium sp. 18065 TaxID=2681411 RepID=UPI00135B8373|nr:helix-turn-helix transcriptional regulator [Rhizobium sp. 18065]
MVSSQAYFELHDWLEQTDHLEPQHFFDRMRQVYGLNHLLYFDGTLRGDRFAAYSLHHTTLPRLAWLSDKRLQTLLHAPFMHAAMAIEPFDWQDLGPRTIAGQNLSTFASLLDLVPLGACYPMLSQAGRTAFLLIQAELPGHEWRNLRRTHDRDIAALAVSFHTKMLARTSAQIRARYAQDRLTPREIETLSWVAAGKSYWEIAVILGITERTVRFFMSNARRKLNVVTNAQAVAEALWRKLISYPHNTTEPTQPSDPNSLIA